MSVRRWLWRHPEVWALALSGAAWLVVCIAAGHDGTNTHPSGTSGPLHLFCSLKLVQPFRGLIAASDGWTPGMFALMVMAMMVPTATGAVRVTAARSLWRRRSRAIAECIAGFVAVWLLAGLAILVARHLAIRIGLFRPNGRALALGLLFAATWEVTPIKRRALNGCHRTHPLAPSGLRADRDCLLYGALVGRECVLSCGPMMAAMTLASRDDVFLMGGLTSVVLVERFRHRIPHRACAASVGLMAILVL